MARQMRVWIVCLCALLASCQPGLQSSPDLDYSTTLERAERLLEQENFEDATDLLSALVHQFPQKPTPWILLGGALDLQNDPEKALEVYQLGLSTLAKKDSANAELALQASLLCVNRQSLSCDPVQPLSHLPANDPRREVVAAATDAVQGNDVAALRRLIQLLEQKLPKSLAGEVYFLAARVYKHMNEPMYVNESLFHAVNFARNPVLVLRIEQLWKPSN